MSLTEPMEVGGVTKIGERGQIVLPQDVRNKLSLKKGERLYVFAGPHEGMLMLIKAEKVTGFIAQLSKKLTLLKAFNKKRSSR